MKACSPGLPFSFLRSSNIRLIVGFRGLWLDNFPEPFQSILRFIGKVFALGEMIPELCFRRLLYEEVSPDLQSELFQLYLGRSFPGPSDVEHKYLLDFGFIKLD